MINNPKPTTHVPLDNVKLNTVQWNAEAHRVFEVEYTFNEFQDMYKKHILTNSTKNPLLHYFEDDTMFVMLFRNKDGVDTYTIIEKSSITSFGQLYTEDSEEAIADFKINYLTNGINILTNPIDMSQAEMSEITSEPLTKAVIDPGEEVIDESKDYAEFMSRTIKSWETKVLKGIDQIDKTVYTKKTFGEFLSQMMNTVNSLPFMKDLKRYVKDSFMAGIEAGENETGIDIGFSTSSEDKVKALQHQELNGYTLPDGKQWHGIKGATKEMQFNILKSVQNGVKDKKTKDDIKKDVKDIFKTASDSSADRIARTETTRFLSEGKVTAFKESGVDGYKVWRAVNDSSTSKECRKLSGTKAEYDDPFFDSKGVSHNYPPQHPNCRCVLEWSRK